jgi:SWI/SNF-related matrix-associated actin-dependent regulator of chromatin subfamily A-like protein 1
MNAIKIRNLKKKVRIEFDYKFDWNFVAVCRELKIPWDAKEKVRHLTFTAATIPLSVNKFLIDYKKLFDYYSDIDKERFKTAFQFLINKYTKTNIEELSYDLSKYPIDEYQKIAIEFLLNRGSAILADDMGIGKTRETSVYILEKKPKKVLIVTPLSVREVWRDELIFLGESEEDFCIVEKEIEKKKYIIINYDKLKKFRTELEKGKWDIIIFDESHYVKERTSQRFKIAKAIAKKCENVICVTGTPIMNKPAELFPLLHLIKHPLGNGFTAFADRYCDRKLVMFGPHGHWDINGASNLNELADKIKDVMIRRLKKDVLEDIPDKEYHVYKINFNQKQQKFYEQIENEYKDYIKSERYIDRANHLAKITKLRQFCSGAKMPITEQHIKDSLNNNEKILVFGFYIDPLNQMHSNYENSLMITGQTKKQDRAQIIKEFQENPYYKIFFGQIIAAGFGITLTAANKVVFNDVYWNPAIHEQSEDRANRRGAVLDTQIYYPLFKGSIEEDIYKLIKEKEKLINKIMDKTIDFYKPESMETELINLMKEKYGK